MVPIPAGDSVVLTFHTDHKNQEKGFHLTFLFSKDGCGSVVNNTLKSPGYPDDYPKNMDCDYLVAIPQNMMLNISFIDFDLENALDDPTC
ncbi:NAP1- protein 2, partial [Desmophyllum pertusum]